MIDKCKIISRFEFSHGLFLFFEERFLFCQNKRKKGAKIQQCSVKTYPGLFFFQAQLASSTELITQLRYDLTIKTDLLHVYTNDAIEESSPLDSKDFNVGILERKIRDLEEENKKLQSEAAELANEAYECEVKEEKLVTDAVKHLTEANVQINYLSEEFNVKETESQKQKEEITHLLAQV